jgi:hypothetical protein
MPPLRMGIKVNKSLIKSGRKTNKDELYEQARPFTANKVAKGQASYFLRNLCPLIYVKMEA